MIPRPIESIAGTDVENLIAQGRVEDRTIEYKSVLPSGADGEKVPWLLKPCCSFGNTDGGDLIFGIRAEEGIPREIVGILNAGREGVQISIQQIVQAGIEPQIRGVRIRVVAVSDTKDVLIVRVPRSWTAPHRVKHNGRFYARSGSGAYELDVPQLRQTFLGTDSIVERIRAFRADRIATVGSDHVPYPIRDGARVILHLVPMRGFAEGASVARTEYSTVRERLCPAGIGGGGDFRINFDGFLVAAGLGEGRCRGYTQLFRNGALEFVHVYSLRLPLAYEMRLVENLRNGLSVLRTLGFEPPIYVMLTLSEVRGYDLEFESAGIELHLIDRDVLALPETEVSSYDLDIPSAMKSQFDLVWNAVGLNGSPNFDEAGKWLRQQGR